jgi:hypothetical protein
MVVAVRRRRGKRVTILVDQRGLRSRCGSLIENKKKKKREKKKEKKNGESKT